MPALATSTLATAEAALAAAGVLALLLVVLVYSIPAIALFRKGHLVGGVLCLILASLMLLAALGQAFVPQARSDDAGDSFFYGGGFIWMLLLIWAAGAPDLTYRREQEAQLNSLRDRVNRIGRQLARVDQLEARVSQLEEYSGSRILAETPPPAFAPAAQGGAIARPSVPQAADARPMVPQQPDGLVSRSEGNDPDATPVFGASTGVEPSAMVKVRCNACGRKFGGTAAQIYSTLSCPRCKATPFEHTPAI